MFLILTCPRVKGGKYCHRVLEFCSSSCRYKIIIKQKNDSKFSTCTFENNLGAKPPILILLWCHVLIRISYQNSYNIFIFIIKIKIGGFLRILL
jgi:hypothetical protein